MRKKKGPLAGAWRDREEGMGVEVLSASAISIHLSRGLV
jgi:hypothetical protein